MIAQAKSARISALIASAVPERNAKYTLKQIHGVISKSGSASMLVRMINFVRRFYLPRIILLQDPLKVIPTLLPVQGEAVKEIMILVGDYCSAKEIIIAVQEAVERIQSRFSVGVDEEEDEENTLSLVGQLDTLILLYSSCTLNFCP
jgi:hypothetical protein